MHVHVHALGGFVVCDFLDYLFCDCCFIASVSEWARSQASKLLCQESCVLLVCEIRERSQVRTLQLHVHVRVHKRGCCRVHACMYTYVTRSRKRYPSAQTFFFELYISRECTRHTLRNDTSCSKITYSVLEVYTEICELRKTH